MIRIRKGADLIQEKLFSNVVWMLAKLKMVSVFDKPMMDRWKRHKMNGHMWTFFAKKRQKAASVFVVFTNCAKQLNEMVWVF